MTDALTSPLRHWRKYVPQFSLRTLLLWTALVAVTTIGLASASRVGAQIALTAVMVAAGITLLTACYGKREVRRRAVGRLVFGGMFFLWTVVHVDRLVPSNGMNAPAFGSISQTLNEIIYDGIITLRGNRQPPASIAISGSPYPMSQVSGQISTTVYFDPTNGVQLYPSSNPGSQPWSPVAGQPITTFLTTPATVNLPYYEFHTIADCFWTLVFGAVGGWLAVLIFRREASLATDSRAARERAPAAQAGET